MTIEEFAQKYCFACGSQRCYGPESEFAYGCLHYRRLFENKDDYMKEILPNLNKHIEERIEEILRGRYK